MKSQFLRGKRRISTDNNYLAEILIKIQFFIEANTRLIEKNSQFRPISVVLNFIEANY
ncbi:hypothetical protein LX69_00364 [Breznakibacter xylanolyticus]|uniref:Uncharacterized protein n=1 Tax=Breznakibacter xylanolyticus TaxID=990 RepID=A0A2W7NQL6_9BACT|nr:hypothetical protein LX69_00364 [Breznakibacter xylanolyticus]